MSSRLHFNSAAPLSGSHNDFDVLLASEWSVETRSFLDELLVRHGRYCARTGVRRKLPPSRTEDIKVVRTDFAMSLLFLRGEPDFYYE
jgi:hypothetical protein